MVSGFFGGAKGGASRTRTDDPHTASVVCYQLRHSPKKLCPSKLHHCQEAFKVAGEGFARSGVVLSHAIAHLRIGCSHREALV